MTEEMVKLTFLGDIICKKQMIESYQISDNKFDFGSIFSDISCVLKKSDYVCGNLETPISVDNSNLTGEEYCFNAPYEFAEAVYQNGVDFVATANNHCLDRGIKGITSTIRSLNKIGILHTGIFEKKENCVKISKELRQKIQT